MPRLPIIISIGFIIAAILGWVSTGRDNINQREIRDPWPNELTAAQNISVKDVVSRLNTSALFPKLSPDSGDGSSALGPDGRPLNGSRQTEAPPFPDIRGVSRLDGQPYVTLEFADGSVKTLAEGAQLSSGWQLKSVDPRRIIATYDDEEITRPVRDYAPGHP